MKKAKYDLKRYEPVLSIRGSLRLGHAGDGVNFE